MGGNAAPNNAKSAASNMMPKNAKMKKLRCQRENGSCSRRAMSSADFASSATVIGFSPGAIALCLSVARHYSKFSQYNHPPDNDATRVVGIRQAGWKIAESRVA